MNKKRLGMIAGLGIALIVIGLAVTVMSFDFFMFFIYGPLITLFTVKVALYMHKRRYH